MTLDEQLEKIELSAWHIQVIVQNLQEGKSKFSILASSAIEYSMPEKQVLLDLLQQVEDNLYIFQYPTDFKDKLKLAIRKIEVSYKRNLENISPQLPDTKAVLIQYDLFKEFFKWELNTLNEFSTKIEGLYKVKPTIKASRKLKWNASTLVFAQVFGQMAEQGYFEAPTLPNEKTNFNELATILCELFEIEVSHEYLRQNLDVENNKMSFDKKMYFPDFAAMKSAAKKLG